MYACFQIYEKKSHQPSSGFLYFPVGFEPCQYPVENAVDEYAAFGRGIVFRYFDVFVERDFGRYAGKVHKFGYGHFHKDEIDHRYSFAVPVFGLLFYHGFVLCGTFFGFAEQAYGEFPVALVLVQGRYFKPRRIFLFDVLHCFEEHGVGYLDVCGPFHVAVLVIDATEGITDQDAKIAGIAHDRGKGMIIAVNKWDAIEKNDKTIYKFTEEIRNKLSYMPYAELLFISAQTGQRLPKLFETIDAVIENHSLRIATGVLNEIMSEAVAMQQPPSDKGKRLKLYYITQVSVKPPTFVIFVNDKELMHFSYTRYIENRIRESFGFRGTPLKFIIRERKEK